MNEALSFFARAVERAAGGSKRFIEGVSVSELPEVGWKLQVSLRDGRELILRASLDAEKSYRRGGVFGWSYERAEPALDGVAARLCERLAQDPETVPDALRNPPRAFEEVERLDIELPGDCDRACVFCANGVDSTRVPGKHLDIVNESFSWRRLETRIRKLAEDKDPAKIRLEWSGRDSIGSPLFDRALALSHELGFGPTSAQSPGSRLADPAYVAEVARLGLGHVSLTAHAFEPETFNRIGGHPKAHEFFWAGVHNLREEGIRIYFEVPFIAENVDELPALAAKLVELDAPVTLFYWHPDPGSQMQYEERPLGLGEVSESLQRIAERVPARKVSIVGIPHCVRPPELANHFIWDHSNHHPIEDHSYADPCSGCQAKEQCPGLPRGYWTYYGPLPPIDDPKDARLRGR